MSDLASWTFKVGDKVVKDRAAWRVNAFDEWKRGIGVGEVVEPPFPLDGEVDVRWPSGRCFEKLDQLLPWRNEGVTIIFLVMDGSHCDYRVDQVFSTRELAERYRAEAGDGFDIVEMELDSPAGLKYIRRQYWLTCINAVTGELDSRPNHYSEMADPCDQGGILDSIKFSPNGDFHPNIAVRSFVSSSHADELAVEAQREFARTQPLERMPLLPRSLSGKKRFLIPLGVPVDECLAWEAKCHPQDWCGNTTKLVDHLTAYADWLDKHGWTERAGTMRTEAELHRAAAMLWK